jgi:hypothetical protein
MGISSRIGWVGMAVQTAKGTPAASPTHTFFTSGSPSLAPVKERPRLSETDSGRDQGRAYTSLLRVEGDIPLYLRPDGAGLLFAAVLGANATTGSSPNFTHTATPANDMPWMTLWRNVGNSVYERFEDVKVSSLALEGSAGNPFTVTLSVIGTKSTFLTSPPSVTPLVSEPYIYHNAENKISIGGTARRVHNFSMTINNNASGYHADQLFYSDVDPGDRGIDFSFATRFAGATAWPSYREFFYGSNVGTELSPVVGTQAVSITLEKNANTSVTLAMPDVSFAAVPVASDPGGAPIEVAVTCTVEKPAAGSIITVTTKDQTATILP